MALGAIMGIGAAIGGAISGVATKNKQKRENLELMEKQAELNKEQAYYSNGLAKSLWDYTNYENTVKHIKEAGLSPGLIYGQGGAGGTTSGAGQAQGVGQPNTTGTMAGLQAKGMALQLGNLASQTKVNEAVAKKTEAEAEKIAGADTRLTEATAGMQERITKLQDTVEQFMKTKENEAAANYFKIQAEEHQIWAHARKTIAEADIAEGRKDEEIRAAMLVNINTMMDTIEKASKVKLNEAQEKYLKDEIAVAWANIALGEKRVSNEADRITNDLMLGLGHLDNESERLLKDWIYEGVNAGKQISGEILNWITRGGSSTVVTVSKKIKEIFDRKGNKTRTVIDSGTTTVNGK